MCKILFLADKQDNWKKFDINGTEWTMVNDIPEDVVPEGFEHSKTVIDGLEYNTLHGTFGDITLVYLQSESGNGLFVYDAAQNAAYEFVRINSESHFIVVLLPKVDDVPEGYNEISLSIDPAEAAFLLFGPGYSAGHADGALHAPPQRGSSDGQTIWNTVRLH